MLTITRIGQGGCPGQLRKTALAMSVALGLGGASSLASAALTSGATLSFTLGTVQVIACTYGTTPPCAKAGYNITDVVGSYFSMDTNSNGVEPSEKTPIGSLNGIVIGATQPASGSHAGPIDGSENPDIDHPWTFFGGTGMHQTTSPVTATASTANGATLDLSGWNVTWNGIASIPLVQTSAATMTCTAGSSCSGTSSYTLDSAFHVNGAGFTTVAYTLHLEGAVTAAGSITANPDSVKTIPGNPINIDVIANDTPASDVDPASVTITSAATIGTATPNAAADGTVDYDPQAAVATDVDTFDYQVGSLTTPATGTATVTVNINANVAPVAADDTLATSTVALDNAGGSVTVSVLANDSDTNNLPGLPGGLDPASVQITGQTVAGTCVANVNGTVTYTQTTPSVTDSGTCTYQVSDVDTANAPLTATANVNINITGIQSDWDSSLDLTSVIPVLVFDAGVPNPSGSSNDVPASGSYFSMAVAPNNPDPTKRNIYVTIAPGTDGGMLIGHDQIALNSHSSVPNGTEIYPMQAPWLFFGNTGMGYSKNGGIVPNPTLAGTLQFAGDPAVNGGQGRYQIAWNGIPEIDLGGSTSFPSDLGFATINCSASAPVNPADTNPCADGDAFELLYDAHVPLGDPSGFGGVLYGLKMVGTISLMDATLQTSNGTVSSESRNSATALANPDAGVVSQCIGDCFDYTITGVTNPSVSVVLPLAGAIPASYIDGQGNSVGPVMRVFNGTWGDFDTSGGDTVLSAAAVAGGAGLTCPPPGNAAYGPLTAGHRCVQVTIADNGLNDKDAAVGTITDPSGIALPAGAAFVDTRTSGSSGCSIASGNAGVRTAGAWVLLAGLITLLGLHRRMKR